MFMILILMTGCQNHNNEIKSLDDLQHARIGCWPTSIAEMYAKKKFPEAQFENLDFISDMVQSLKQNKIDAFLLDSVYAENLISEGISVDYIKEPIGEVKIAYVFSKTEEGQKLCNQVNDFIKKLNDTGELDKLKQKWLKGNESSRNFTKSKLTGKNGKLKIATEAVSVPYDYIKDNNVVGYEVEIIDKFCVEYDYDYDIVVEEFMAMLVDVNLNKVNIGMSSIQVTEEKAKRVLFSEPTNVDNIVAIINPTSKATTSSAENDNFIDSIKNRVNAVLITENRWQMIVEGIKITILITILASIFGTLLGFAIYMIYREKNKIINKIIEKFIRIMQGLPQMVLLMFFYYVVFGNVDVSGTIVAIIVFAIMWSISTFIMLKSGSESIPKGQMEAALALGFSERRAYLKFILPQVITVFFPTYQKSLIELLLSTAIVGYIAVQDLTKIGDLIRARTFDAFVPLIIVSAIYFLLSWLLMILMEKILSSINPKNRKAEEILKGVKL